MHDQFPKATLAHCPRILREEADERESNGSGREERFHLTCNSDAAGLRYLAYLVELGDYDTAYAMTNGWSLSQRCMIPRPVYKWMSAAFQPWILKNS